MFNALACPVYLGLSSFFKLLSLSFLISSLCLPPSSFLLLCLSVFLIFFLSLFLSPLVHTGTHAQAAPHLLAHTVPH